MDAAVDAAVERPLAWRAEVRVLPLAGAGVFVKGGWRFLCECAEVPLPMADEGWLSSVAIRVRSFSFCVCFWSASDSGIAMGTVSRMYMSTRYDGEMKTRALKERIATV